MNLEFAQCPVKIAPNYCHHQHELLAIKLQKQQKRKSEGNSIIAVAEKARRTIS